MATISKMRHGEGNPGSGKRFNEAETRFVDSTRGKRNIRDGANVRPDQGSALIDAALLGRTRIKISDAPVPDVPAQKR